MQNLTELIPGGTGSAMLFSAGTFLYVATVHVLPEVGKPDRRKTALMVLELGRQRKILWDKHGPPPRTTG